MKSVGGGGGWAVRCDVDVEGEVRQSLGHRSSWELRDSMPLNKSPTNNAGGKSKKLDKKLYDGRLKSSVGNVGGGGRGGRWFAGSHLEDVVFDLDFPPTFLRQANRWPQVAATPPSLGPRGLWSAEMTMEFEIKQYQIIGGICSVKR